MYGIMVQNTKGYFWEAFERVKVFSKPQMALVTMEISMNRSLKEYVKSSCRTETDIRGFCETVKRMERVLFILRTQASISTAIGKTMSFSNTHLSDDDLQYSYLISYLLLSYLIVAHRIKDVRNYMKGYISNYLKNMIMRELRGLHYLHSTFLFFNYWLR